MKDRNLYKANRVGKGIVIMSFIVGIIMAVSSLCQAATYYLDLSRGNDGNPGTGQAPWRTLPRAMVNYSGSGNRVTYGDTVVIYNGDYGPFVLPHDDLRLYEGDRNEVLSSLTPWVTYRAASGNDQVYFGYIEINKSYAEEQRLVAHIFDGINVVNEGGPCVLMHYGVGLRLRNMFLSGKKNTIDVEQGDRSYFNVVRLRYTICDVKIENCDIEAGYDGIYLHDPRNVVISGCDIHDNGCDKIMSGGGYNLTIEGNRLHGSRYLVPGSHPDCIQMYTAADRYGDGARMTNLTIRNNILYDHPSQGIWTGGSYLENVLFENNLIYNCANYEWRVYSVHGGLFRNNTIIANTNGNTGFVIYGEEFNSDITIVNNILAIPYSGSEAVLTYHDYNIYVPAWSGSPGYNESNSYEYASMEEAAGDLFVDAAARDYRLKAASRAINRGNTVYASATDIEGRVRDSMPDLGCYEFLDGDGTTVPPPAGPGDPDVVYGDVSDDSNVTAYDAALTARHAAELIQLDLNQMERADVNRDNIITAIDAAQIARYAAQLIENF